MNINNITANCFVCLSAIAGVKESEIRLPLGLLNVNSLPTYFQLTSNQQALFRGTNNRIKRPDMQHGGADGQRLDIRDRSAINSIKKLHAADFYSSRGEDFIYGAVRNRVSLVGVFCYGFKRGFRSDVRSHFALCMYATVLRMHFQLADV